MVTLFSCIGVHAFCYWSVPVVSESLPCTPISLSSHRPGNSERISHALRSILACPRKHFVPFLLYICLGREFYTSLMALSGRE